MFDQALTWITIAMVSVIALLGLAVVAFVVVAWKLYSMKEPFKKDMPPRHPAHW